MTFSNTCIEFCFFILLVTVLVNASENETQVITGVPEVFIGDYGEASRTFLSVKDKHHSMIELDDETLTSDNFKTIMHAVKQRRAVSVSYVEKQPEIDGRLLKRDASDSVLAHVENVEVVVDQGKDVERFSDSTVDDDILDGNKNNAREELGGSSTSVKLLVVIVEIEGMKSNTCTRDKAISTFYDANKSVASYYASVSRGRVTFPRLNRGGSDEMANADVVGPYTIKGVPTESCEPHAWTDAALWIARRDAVEIWQYDSIVTVLPPDIPCTWLGLASTNCLPDCKLWVKQCEDAYIIGHELGHNLGLMHAASRYHESDDYVEYGDPTSIMGNKWIYAPYFPDMTVPHLVQLGWIPSSQIVRVSDSSGGGTFSFAPLNKLSEELSSDSPLPQALRVDHPISGKAFYFSYRTSENVNSSMKVVVHRWTSRYDTTELLAVLDEGDSYTDKSSQLYVHVNNITVYAMSLTVEFECVRNEPSLSIFETFPDSNGVPLSAELSLSDSSPDAYFALLSKSKRNNFTIYIKNNDLGVCQSSVFQVGFSANDLSFVNSMPKVSLAPGEVCGIPITPSWENNVDSAEFVVNVSRIYHITSRVVEENSSDLASDYATLRVSVSMLGEGCNSRPPFGYIEQLEGDEYKRVDSIVVRSAQSVQLRATLLRRDIACSRKLNYVMQASPNGYCPPNGIKVTFVDSDEVSLQSNTSSTIKFNISARKKLTISENSGCMIDIIMSQSSLSGKDIAFSVPLVVKAACPEKPKLVSSVIPSSLPLRNAQWFSVELAGFDVRGSTEYDGCKYSVKAPRGLGKVDGFQVLSSSDVVTVWNGTASVRFAMSVSDMIRPNTVSESVEVGGSKFSFNTTIDKSEAECIVNDVFFSVSCDSLTVDPGAPAGGVCSVVVRNKDSWYCSSSIFVLQKPILTPTYELDEEFEDYAFIMGPGERETFDFPFHRKEYVDGSLEEEVFVTINLYDYSREKKHEDSASLSIKTGECIRRDPIVELVSNFTENPVHPWQPISATFRVKNNDTGYCERGVVKVKVRSANKTCVTSYTPASTIRLGPGDSRVFTVNAYDKRNAEANSSVESVQVSFSAGLSYGGHVGNYSMENSTFFVNASCTYQTAKITPLESDLMLHYGAPNTLTFTFNVSTLDEELMCPDQTLYYFYGNPTTDAPRLVIEPGIFTLSPGEWELVSVTASTRKNIAPGAHSILMVASVDDRPQSAMEVVSFNVTCPDEPAAPYDLSITQSTPLFSSKTEADLSWRACDIAGSCCCPCTYSIYRNGDLIGVTPNLTFHDENSLSSDKTYNYTVKTIDSRGVESSIACSSSQFVAGESADLETFIVLLVSVIIVAIIIIATIITIICIVRWTSIKPYMVRMRNHLSCGKSYKKSVEMEDVAGIDVFDEDDIAQVVDV